MTEKPYSVVRPYGAGYENHITVIGRATNGRIMVRCFNIAAHTETEIPHTVFTWTIDDPDNRSVAATGGTAEAAVAALVEVVRKWMTILERYESERLVQRVENAGLHVVGAHGPERIAEVTNQFWLPDVGVR